MENMENDLETVNNKVNALADFLGVNFKEVPKHVICQQIEFLKALPKQKRMIRTTGLKELIERK